MRIENWETHLWNYLERVRKQPFRWGSFDCCLFACGAIEAMTGIDPSLEFSRSYTNREEAQTVLLGATQKETFEEAITFLAARYEYIEISPEFAGRGDLILIEGDYGPTLGIVDFCGCHGLFPSARGLTCLPRSRIIRAWSI